MSKKTTKHFVLAFVVVAIAAFAFVACGGDTQDASPEDTSGAVANDLTQDEEAVIDEEFEAQAAAEIQEGNAEAKLQELEKEINADL